MLIARGRLKHQYPHSWRSKKPVIFRNTPQWFIAMDKPLRPSLSPLTGRGRVRGGRPQRAAPTLTLSARGRGTRRQPTLREVALQAIAETEFVPASGQNRLRGMVESKPDWVISRQRAWGVPITVFQHKETGEVIPSATFAKSDELMARIRAAMTEKGADAWFEAGARERFLAGLVANPADWEQVTDILDVWFDSGSTHTFTLEDPRGVPRPRRHRAPARRRPGPRHVPGRLRPAPRLVPVLAAGELRHARRARPSTWCSPTASSSTRRARRRCSKSKGNVLSPQDLMKTSGADILRLWVASSDYSSDIRFGPAILQGTAESYRKLRNTLRWMLGMLAHYDGKQTVAAKDMPELERLMLHRLAELDEHHPRGLRRLRLQARGGGAVALHEHRPVGVLRRHPQGRALLRALSRRPSARRRWRPSSRSSAAPACGWRR